MLFVLARGGRRSTNTPLHSERVQRTKTLTSSVLVLVSFGGLVVRDAPHHARLVADHLGFDCRIRLYQFPVFNDLFLGLDNLFFGRFGRRFNSRALFVGYFYSLLGFCSLERNSHYVRILVIVACVFYTWLISSPFRCNDSKRNITDD